METKFSMDLTDVRGLLQGHVHKKTRIMVAAAIGKGLALMSRHHKKKEMVRKKGKGIGGATPPKLNYRTGELARSYRIHHIKNRMQGSYGSDLPRSVKLEKGGEIRPKKAKFLAIPMPGVKGGPREYGNLVFLKTKQGGLYMGEPKGDMVNIMFTLKKSVTLPPRPTMENTVRKTSDKVTKLIADAVEKGLAENG